MNQTTGRTSSERTPARTAMPSDTPRAIAEHPDVVIRRLAAGQHGVVSRRQLLAAGLSRAQIDRRVLAGRLDRLHRGVFRAGPVAAPLEREMAAVLASARGAWVSHGTAGRIWALLPPAATALPVEISVVGGYGAPALGVRMRRVSVFDAAEVVCRDGLPITTPERTLLDLAVVIASGHLEQALARSFVS
jgi:hypothetical protein